jgi:hypothetical protein
VDDLARGSGLRGANRSVSGRGSWAQKSLVIGQAAMSIVLLSAAALLGKSLRNLEHQNFGFATEGRYLVSITPRWALLYSMRRCRAIAGTTVFGSPADPSPRPGKIRAPAGRARCRVSSKPSARRWPWAVPLRRACDLLDLSCLPHIQLAVLQAPQQSRHPERSRATV